MEDYADDVNFKVRSVCLYAGLTDLQCLKVGYDHNVTMQLHHSTTFEELVLLFRKELIRCQDQRDGNIPPLNHLIHKKWCDRPDNLNEGKLS